MIISTKIIGIDLNTLEVISKTRLPAYTMVDNFLYMEKDDTIVDSYFYTGTVVVLKNISIMDILLIITKVY